MATRRLDINSLLTRYDDGESAIAKAWQELVICTVGLGAACARWDNAIKAFVAAQAKNGDKMTGEGDGGAADGTSPGVDYSTRN